MPVVALEALLENAVQAAIDGQDLPTWTALATAVVWAPEGGKSESASYFRGSPYSAGTGQPATLDGSTRFALASSTKTFTATLIVAADADKGGILDAEIGTYVQGLPDNVAQLIVGDLLSYSSGLPYDNRPNPTDPDAPADKSYPYCTLQMLQYLRSHGVTIEPGNPYLYSNLGFALAALGAPAMVGEDQLYETLVQAMVHDLGMTNTSFYRPPLNDKLLRSFNPETCQPLAVANATWPAYNGAGGLVSTLDDMTKWIALNMGLDPKSPLTPLLKTLQGPVAHNAGYGWFVGTTQVGSKTIPIVSKDGGVAGTSSWLELDAGHRLGLVMLANAQEVAPTFGKQVFDTLASELLQ